MSTILTNLGASAALNAIVGQKTWAAANKFAAPFTGDPLSGGVEQMLAIAGTNIRPGITGSFANTSTDVILNNIDIIFAYSANTAVTVDYVAIFDAPTAGNIWLRAPLLHAVKVVPGTVCKIPVNALIINFV